MTSAHFSGVHGLVGILLLLFTSFLTFYFYFYFLILFLLFYFYSYFSGVHGLVGILLFLNQRQMKSIIVGPVFGRYVCD